MSERFSMNHFKPLSLNEKLSRMEEKRRSLENDRLPIIERKKEIGVELSAFRARVRTGGMLEPNEYKAICDKQEGLKKELLQVEKNISENNRQLSAINSEIDSFKRQMKTLVKDEVKDSLEALRDKYTSFAKDRSRVSSMRAMAAEFVEDLQETLKLLN